ncbi:MAG: hypothetical protein ACKO5K_12920 [Armatimonadota bacterium]
MKKIILAAIFCSASTAAFAQYSAGSIVQNVATGHYYQLFTGSATWDEANSYTALLSHNGFQGHLATVTSQDETDFLVDVFGGSMLADKSIGGRQAPGAGARDSDWSWITGEAWDYEFWHSGEPNDNYSPIEVGNENALQFAHNNSNGSWNDIPFSGYAPNGFLVEYSGSPVEGEPVPEPGEWSAMGLLGAGLALLTLKGRMRRNGSARQG